MAVFPGGVKSFTNPTAANNLDTAGVVHHVEHSDANDEINAVETYLNTAELKHGERTTTTPAAPAAGVITFARKRAGRRMLAQIGPSGLDYPFQACLGMNMVALFRPLGNSVTVQGFGFTNTATGTATIANVATTDFRQSLKRLMYVSAATAGASSGWRNASLQYWRGNAAGLGGFFLAVRFAFATTPASSRGFIGMSGTVGALANVEPDTFLNMVGVGFKTTQANFQVMGNDAAGTATMVDTGIARSSTTKVFEMRLFCKPNGTMVDVSLEDIATGTVFDTTISAAGDLPANTTLLTPQLWYNNGATAAAANLDVVGVYMETDY